RDFHVTGVQTCALPISPIAGSPGPIKKFHDGIGREKLKKNIVKTAGKPVSGFGSSGFSPGHGVSPYFTRGDQLPKRIALATFYRSEERRVGQGCRSGRA